MHSVINKITQDDQTISMEYNTGGIKKFTIHQVPGTKIYVAEDMYNNRMQTFKCDGKIKTIVRITAAMFKIPLDDKCEYPRKELEHEYMVNICQTWSEDVKVKAKNARQANTRGWDQWQAKKNNYQISAKRID